MHHEKLVSEELRSYLQHGYYCAKSLLPIKDVERVRESFAKTFSEQIQLTQTSAASHELLSLMKELFETDIERYKKVVASLWRKLDVYQLMHHPKIIEFLNVKFGWSDIVVPGGQVVLIMSKELKIPGGYFGLAPHQDFPSVQGSLDGVIVWIPLTEVTANNFPLEVVPKSHLHGLLPRDANKEASWEVTPESYRDDDFEKIIASPGDVVFMSLFTLHRSAIDGDIGKLRIALSTRFDNADEPSFQQRAYPSAYLRSVHREPLQEGFPSQEQVENIFRLK